MTTENQHTTIQALIANTEAMSALQGAIQSLQGELLELKNSNNERANTISAKVENLDRTLGEFSLLYETDAKKRISEAEKIFSLLKEEREERRQMTTNTRENEQEARQQEREAREDSALTLKDQVALIRQEVAEERAREVQAKEQQTNLIVQASKAIWDVGGKYIVAAISLVFVAVVMKMTGLSLVDIVGVVGGGK